MTAGLETEDVVVLTKAIGFALVINNTGVIATSTRRMIHDVTLILPRTCRTVAHGITNTFGTAGGSKSQVIMSVALVEPGAFLIVLYLRKFHNVARIRNHILVELYIIRIRISPVHISLTVIIDKYTRVDIVPMFLLPNQWFSNRIFERSVRRIAHQYADAMTVNRAIHVPLSVAVYHTDSPSAVIAFIPLIKVLQRSDRTTVLPIHHIGRSIEQPVLHLKAFGIVLVVTCVKINRIIINQRCWVGRIFSLNNGHIQFGPLTIGILCHHQPGHT